MGEKQRILKSLQLLFMTTQKGIP